METQSNEPFKTEFSTSVHLDGSIEHFNHTEMSHTMPYLLDEQGKHVVIPPHSSYRYTPPPYDCHPRN